MGGCPLPVHYCWSKASHCFHSHSQGGQCTRHWHQVWRSGSAWTLPPLMGAVHLPENTQKCPLWETHVITPGVSVSPSSVCPAGILWQLLREITSIFLPCQYCLASFALLWKRVTSQGPEVEVGKELCGRAWNSRPVTVPGELGRHCLRWKLGLCS